MIYDMLLSLRTESKLNQVLSTKEGQSIENVSFASLISVLEPCEIGLIVLINSVYEEYHIYLQSPTISIEKEANDNTNDDNSNGKP